MESPGSGLVDIVREFLDVQEQTRSLFERFRSGDLEFEPVRRLFADTDESPLFRLKERCHALFREGAAARLDEQGVEAGPMRREALFDLAVGSLFHEAMKFRENFYQQKVYAPRVEALREQQDNGADELFREFEKILDGAAVRIEEALQESETLLALTRNQLRVLLSGQSNGLVTRYLIEQRERVEPLLTGGLEALLAEMHGDPLAAYLSSANSYLKSAHFVQALVALEQAERVAGGRSEVARLGLYARGMQAFMAGEYAASLDALQAWVEAGPASGEAAFVSLAHSAISRVERLVESGSDLVKRAEELAARMEPLLEAGPPEIEGPGAPQL
jgi:hypothetical protein